MGNANGSRDRRGHAWRGRVLALGLGATATFACDPDAQKRGLHPGLAGADDVPDEIPISEIQEGLDQPLSEAASHLRDESHWVQPEPPSPPPPDDAPNEPPPPPPPTATCDGHCGGEGSDKSCWCDAQCETNGDCCPDFAQQCDAGGGGGGATATCQGHCGGQSADKSCWCDADCETNDDCCSDYANACASSKGGHGLTFEFTSEHRSPMASSSGACWALITDPIDVDQIVEHAVGGGALVGGTCVAIAVVPAGAAAAPTGGVSVGAAALACTSVALGGSIRGAVASLLSQKMGSITECSSSVVSEVIRIFPWGTGVKTVHIPVFKRNDPGHCSEDQHRKLQDKVNESCKNHGKRRCTYENSCATILGKLDVSAACVDARNDINDACYAGGDGAHQGAVNQELNLQGHCHDLYTALEC